LQSRRSSKLTPDYFDKVIEVLLKDKDKLDAERRKEVASDAGFGAHKYLIALSHQPGIFWGIGLENFTF
jgi:hypothetical protein